MHRISAMKKVFTHNPLMSTPWRAISGITTRAVLPARRQTVSVVTTGRCR
jgi:hypothetical protein